MLVDSEYLPHERTTRRHHAALRELATFAAAYLTYFGVRAVTEGAPWRAFDNAIALFRIETDLRHLRDQGLGIVVITHNIDVVFEVADRIVVLCMGRRTATFDQRETTPREVVSAIVGLDEA